MFQYEKQEIQIKDTHKKYILLWVIGSVLIIGMLITIPLVKLAIQSRVNKNHLDKSEIQNIINENFRTCLLYTSSETAEAYGDASAVFFLLKKN